MISFLIAGFAASTALIASPAMAGEPRVGFSLNVGVPLYAPAPVYYAPQPVYVAPPPVYDAPRRVIYQSAPIVEYRESYGYPSPYRHHHHHRRHHHHHND